MFLLPLCMSRHVGMMDLSLVTDTILQSEPESEPEPITREDIMVKLRNQSNVILEIKLTTIVENVNAVISDFLPNERFQISSDSNRDEILIALLERLFSIESIMCDEDAQKPVMMTIHSLPPYALSNNIQKLIRAIDELKLSELDNDACIICARNFRKMLQQHIDTASDNTSIQDPGLMLFFIVKSIMECIRKLIVLGRILDRV